MKSTYLACMLAAGLLFEIGVASAADPITASNAFYYRENRGVNDVGQTAGDRISYGANVLPNGASGTTATKTFTNPAATPLGTTPLSFGPNTVSPNQFAGSQVYDANRAGGITFDFVNPGYDSLSITFGALGDIGLMPLALNLGVTGSGTNLTFNWDLPDLTGTGLTLDREQIRVYDLAGVNDAIFSQNLPGSATSFEAIANGLNLQLGRQYAFGIRLENLRTQSPSDFCTGSIDACSSNAALRLSSSQAFYSFTTAPIPEPEIYAMLGLGLGLLGWVGRRKKLKEAAVT
jgi:hypothetical protein